MQGANKVVGYVTSDNGVGRMWHTNPACEQMNDPATTCTAKNLPALIRDQTEKGHYCCRNCTIAAVLDYALSYASGPGYHALTCAAWHGTRGNPLGRGPCELCEELTVYGAGTLVGLTDGHVTLLRTGTIEGATGYLREAMIEIRNADGTSLPPMDEPRWKTAATLIGEHGMRQALEVAAAVHGPQLRGPQPRR